MKIGMLTSGGDCQGLNAALRGVAKTLYNELGDNVRIYGIRDGYRGLIEGDYHEMRPDDFSDILTLGGTILGTSRQPFKQMQRPVEDSEQTKLDKMLKTVKKAGFDCLVILGGNGTHKTANLLREKGVNVVTLPKTIDNDLWGTEMTFGFQSAVDIAAMVIDSIHSTAFSHSRVFIVEIMGHKAGWLTLHAGIASGADVIVIPEIPYSAKKIAQAIEKRAKNGKRFSIIAVAEGAVSCEEAAMSKKEFKASREAMPYPVGVLPARGRAEGADRAGNPRDHSRPFSARRRSLRGGPRALEPLRRGGGRAYPRRQFRQHGRAAGRQNRSRAALRGRGQAENRAARLRDRGAGACARPVDGRLIQTEKHLRISVFSRFRRCFLLFYRVRRA